jgi:hypothetical protein
MLWDKEKGEYVKNLRGSLPRLYVTRATASSAAFHLVSPMTYMNENEQRRIKSERFEIHEIEVTYRKAHPC